MSETTNFQLALDNGHLNRIIALLIEQNDGLKKENEWLKMHIGLKEQGMPDAQIHEAFTAFWKSHMQTNVGLTEARQSYVQMHVGLTELSQSNPQMRVGHPEFNQSHMQTDVGQTEVRQPYVQMQVGLSKQSLPTTQMHVGQTTENSPLPAVIQPDSQLISALVKTLKEAGFKHAEVSTVRNAATLMFHFYNKGGGSYQELKKITNLSMGGLSKFMTSFRRRGLIKRYAFQKFELTPHGLNLLQQAYSKVKK
ncbi:MAG: hypothetical protein V4615_04385 [Bacteroidota bacterium]